MDILFNFHNLINKHNFKNNKFLIGYSGGLDSTVLLYNIYLIQKIYNNFFFRVIHINHNINNLSNKWAMHCFKQCKKLRLCLIIVNLNQKIFKKHNKIYGGLEARARYIRHKIYKIYLLKDEILLLGHHLQDQSENFFLSLKRSSGPKGLSGIKQKITLYKKITIFRPMLTISKDKIYDFAKQNNLSWIEDPSNKNCYYERNYIRINILPKLRTKWPYIEKSINRSAFLCSLQEELLEELLLKQFKQLINLKINNALNFVPLLKMSKAKQYYILRLWIKHMKPNFSPNYKLVFNILKNVVCTKKDSNPILKFHKYEIRKYRNFIYFVNFISKEKLKQIVIQCYYPWKNINLPYKLGTIIQVDKYSILGTPIRIPLPNEKMFIKFHINHKVSVTKLNNIFKEKYIPHWLRCRIPLLYYNSTLVASPNFFVLNQADKSNYLSNFDNIKNYIYLQWIHPNIF